MSTSALAPLAVELGIPEAVLLGRGEDASGGRTKPSILADAFEAVVGAVYLSGGIEPARQLVLERLGGRIAEIAEEARRGDFKNRLQELAARLGLPAPRYDVEGSGPDHARWFRARVLLGDDVLGEGEGRSKKRAEQHAARAAWRALESLRRSPSGPPPEPAP